MDSIIANMIPKAHSLLANSYAPYSRFNVACCIESEAGNFYTGVNIENSSYGLTVCAETSAISAMVTAGECRIKNIVILAGTNKLCSPCGACRQRIHEFAISGTMVHLCNKDSILHSLSIKELLPLAFDFDVKP
ncbi:MAG: cytidine deaminase [Legionella sp.]|uniref:cytidine deaminase n=1 Tax=Legionella sp. TaxID=459 RepID=UPI0039E2F84D